MTWSTINFVRYLRAIENKEHELFNLNINSIDKPNSKEFANLIDFEKTFKFTERMQSSLFSEAQNIIATANRAQIKNQLVDFDTIISRYNNLI